MILVAGKSTELVTPDTKGAQIVPEANTLPVPPMPLQMPYGKFSKSVKKIAPATYFTLFGGGNFV